MYADVFFRDSSIQSHFKLLEFMARPVSWITRLKDILPTLNLSQPTFTVREARAKVLNGTLCAELPAEVRA